MIVENGKHGGLCCVVKVKDVAVTFVEGLDHKGLTDSSVSKLQTDKILQKLLSTEEYFVHYKCYKTYTAAQNVTRAQKGSTGSSDSVPKFR